MTLTCRVWACRGDSPCYARQTLHRLAHLYSGSHRLRQDDSGPYSDAATRLTGCGTGRYLLAPQLAGEALIRAADDFASFLKYSLVQVCTRGGSDAAD